MEKANFIKNKTIISSALHILDQMVISKEEDDIISRENLPQAKKLLRELEYEFDNAIK